MSDKALVQLSDVSKYFPMPGKQTLKAVDHVSFEIRRGETVGLVGESGCGKSTTGRCIVRLHEPTHGVITYGGKDIFRLSKQESREFTRKVQMIFQNPYSSLNPRMTVSEIVSEGMKLHGHYSQKELEEKVEVLLNRVGLGKEHMSRFSHEFSGGQRQRIGIARALSVDPEFIVCDEPVSALDVSVQAQVVNMLKELQQELSLTYLFIAHDLSVVHYISDRVVVMYLGNVVEEAPAEELYSHPLHPYTQALLSAIPVADPDVAQSSKRIELKGEVQSPIDLEDTCHFADRCPYASEKCRNRPQRLKEVSHDHRVACTMVTGE